MGLKYFKDRKAFIEYSNDLNDLNHGYQIIHPHDSSLKRKSYDILTTKNQEEELKCYNLSKCFTTNNTCTSKNR